MWRSGLYEYSNSQQIVGGQSEYEQQSKQESMHQSLISDQKPSQIDVPRFINPQSTSKVFQLMNQINQLKDIVRDNSMLTKMFYSTGDMKIYPWQIGLLDNDQNGDEQQRRQEDEEDINEEKSQEGNQIRQAKLRTSQQCSSINDLKNYNALRQKFQGKMTLAHRKRIAENRTKAQNLLLYFEDQLKTERQLLEKDAKNQHFCLFCNKKFPSGRHYGGHMSRLHPKTNFDPMKKQLTKQRNKVKKQKKKMILKQRKQ